MRQSGDDIAVSAVITAPGQHQSVRASGHKARKQLKLASSGPLHQFDAGNAQGVYGMAIHGLYGSGGIKGGG
jgi:hypothetical protein